MLRRPTLAFAAVVGLALAVTGCSTTGSAQRDLAARLDDLDGVTSTTYTLTDSIFQLPVHFLKIIVATDLSAEDAQRIAHESCNPTIEISNLTVTTNDDTLAPRAVVTSQNGVDTTSCMDENELVAFSLASDVMNKLGPDYDGRFSVFLGGLDGTIPDALSVRTFASDRTRLVDALRALHNRYHGPIDFTGKWAKSGDEYLPSLPEFAAQLTDDADLDTLTPLIGRAFDLGVGDIAVNDSTLSVEITDDTAPGAEAALRAIADAAGITLTATVPQ
ncbi:hypothetical protein ACL9RL_17770 [Plantibacter sp. Mn2098]|uniref:hypothetical protein n=1 Tax=Plantibacter sp. Mn2098 TaxID=3395266 RepID=UPI003BD00B40